MRTGSYTSVDYYYYNLPNIETYYDIRQSQFIYLKRGIWMRSRYYLDNIKYDLNSGYKVVLKINMAQDLILILETTVKHIIKGVRVFR